MNAHARVTRSRVAITAGALLIVGAASFARIDRAITAGSAPEVTTETAPPAPSTGAPLHAQAAEALGPSANGPSSRARTPTAQPAHGASVVGKLMARHRPEDLELLTAVARRTSAPPPPAVHRLLAAARAGASDDELSRAIRQDVQGALVRHDCFEWLRRRRGDPRPRPPALASQARRGAR